MIAVEIDLNRKELIRETLTRMGIASKKTKELWQSCHLIEVDGVWIIAHFKEIFIMSGRDSTLSDEDQIRAKSIAKMLESWNLVRLVKPIDVSETEKNFAILKASDKAEWTLHSKINLKEKA